MKRRCYSPGRRGYERYGGRGITVCERWLSGDGQKSGFACFLEDMGLRPGPEYTLDRKDNEGHYTPENCKWARRSEQDYNKRNTVKITAFGREYTLAEAEREFGISKGALYQRLFTRNMPPEEALTRPLRRN